MDPDLEDAEAMFDHQARVRAYDTEFAPCSPVEQVLIERRLIEAMGARSSIPLSGYAPIKYGKTSRRFTSTKTPGCYALVYDGPLDCYSRIRGRMPIYVGQAEDIPERLRKHAESIDSACNLSVSEFKVKYLVLRSLWIGLGEAVLLDGYKPVWNLCLKGFGAKELGSQRATSDVSLWDTLHGGRERSSAAPTTPLEEVEARVRSYLASVEP